MRGIRDWIIVKLGDISQIINGSTPNTNIDEFWNGDIIWVTPKDLGRLNNKEIHTSERKITAKGYNSANLTIIPPNCIVLSTRAPIGYIAITKNELCFNQGCKGIVPNENVFTDFLYYYLFFIRESLEILGSGSIFKELSLTNLQKVDVLLPPLVEQKRIVKIIETKLATVEKAKKLIDEQSAYINALPSSILRKAFKGEL